jgi:hypothetical protein
MAKIFLTDMNEEDYLQSYSYKLTLWASREELGQLREFLVNSPGRFKIIRDIRDKLNEFFSPPQSRHIWVLLGKAGDCCYRACEVCGAVQKVQKDPLDWGGFDPHVCWGSVYNGNGVCVPNPK